MTYLITTDLTYSGPLTNTAVMTTTIPPLSNRATVTTTIQRSGLAISDATVTEGDSGNRTLIFFVSRTHNLNTVTVDYATLDGTATAGGDYLAATDTLTFTAGGC
ncbi:MAG: Calx-beta domain-containing protein [Caldilineaceae bacterium]